MSIVRPDRAGGRLALRGRIVARLAPLLLLAGPGAAVAQNVGAANGPLYQALGSPDNWTIEGSFRVRLEGIDNQFRPALNHSDAALMLQSTLFAEYKTGGLRLGGEMLDARSYFEKKATSVSSNDVDAAELMQAYAAYDFGKVLGGTSAVLTGGRQTLNDGGRRLIARQTFRNDINAFTGVRFDWQDKGKDQLRLFWFMPHIRLPVDADGVRHADVQWDHEGTDLQFWGGSFTKAHVLGGSLEVYGYKLAERDTPEFATRDRHIVTTGARLARAPRAKQWDWEFEGIYQFGHAHGTTAASDRLSQPVSAYFAHAEVGYSFDAPWSPRLLFRSDIASGDGSNRNRYNRFDSLFGDSRFEYGPTSLYSAIQRANMIAPAIQVELQPSKRSDFFVQWRGLWLQSRYDSFAGTGVRDATGSSGRFAGNQVEARYRLWLVPKRVRLDTGAAALLKGHFLRDAPNAPATGNTLYGYTMVEISL